MAEEWFEEFLRSGKGKLYKGDGGEFVIYKGFKIARDLEGYKILDVRSTDFYTELQPRDFRILHCYGFVKGADMIMYYRDCRRVKIYQKRLEERYIERDQLREQRSKTDPRRYKIKMDTVERSLRDYLDNVFFYETRKRQIEIKYKLQENE